MDMSDYGMPLLFDWGKAQAIVTCSCIGGPSAEGSGVKGGN